ncbi:MAG: carboxypeptidase-like regulatory domain-containing protein [Acidobacteriota bacterium]
MRGKVVNEAEEPLVGASVTLKLGEEGPETLVTNQKGEWAYLGLASGNWTILVEMEGYVPAEAEIPLQQSDKGKTPLVMMLRELTPEMMAQANPAVAKPPWRPSRPKVMPTYTSLLPAPTISKRTWSRPRPPCARCSSSSPTT